MARIPWRSFLPDLLGSLLFVCLLLAALIGGGGLELQWRAVTFAWAFEILLWALPLAFFSAFARRRWISYSAHAGLVLVLYAANAFKISHIGSPLFPQDLIALRNLNDILLPGEFRTAVMMLTLAALGIGAHLLNTRWRSIPLWAYAVAVLLLQPVFSYGLPVGAIANRTSFGWTNPVEICRRRGPLLNYLIESAGIRQVARTNRPASHEEVETAMKFLAGGTRAPRAAATNRRSLRNVYFILLESFWDPSRFFPGLVKDSFVPEFRRLWESGGKSFSISPTFGTRTANVEFELLCGIPSSLLGDIVEFRSALRRNVPCLPRILSKVGYETYVFDPISTEYFNERQSYRFLGFTRIMTDGFKLDDLNGPHLSDQSLYLQVLERLRATPAVPRFTFILTHTGHYPFNLDPLRRPLRFAPPMPLIGAAANATYYASSEVTELIAKLHQSDPEALVVVLGDHLPPIPALREKLDRETRSGFYETPLLVIDGRSGVLRPGTVPTYTLPSLALRLLGIEPEGTALRWFMQRREFGIRPLPLSTLLVGPDRMEKLCSAGQPFVECAYAASWRKAARVISTDILLGDSIAANPS